MSTLQVVNAKHPSSASNNIVLDNAGNATFAGTAAMASSFLRNRIINGDMRIDQRNAGGSVTINTAADTFTVDRFSVAGQAADGVMTAQRNSDAPAGFNTSLLVTVTTPDTSIGASQYYDLLQQIEGFNVADFNLGTASARTFTLSFWVKCSLTGTFGGAFRNGLFNRSYPFTYTISAANTWEYKTITVAGDTTGTWNTENGSGLTVTWSFGEGSSRLAAAGAWAAGNFAGATGQTNLISTNGATFRITGVQLEVGSAATPFERRQFGQELALCQRYFCKYYNLNEVPGTPFTLSTYRGLISTSGFRASFGFKFPVTMRAVPTVTLYNSSTGAAGSAYNEDIGTNPSAVAYFITQEGLSGIDVFSPNPAPGNCINITYTASAEL